MIRIAGPRAGTVRVTFALPADTPPASVVGDFNDWDPYAAPMRRRSNGTRSAVVEVPTGSELRFRYLVDDGQWLLDPDAERVPGPYEDDALLQV